MLSKCKVWHGLFCVQSNHNVLTSFVASAYRIIDMEGEYLQGYVL